MKFDESLGNGKIEIRPGRALVCRRITIGRHPPKINLLFVHGSCAASSQYDDLITEMTKLVQQDNDHLSEGSQHFNTPMNCFLYDQLGCAESDHPASDWSAFSSSELHLDLQTIFRSILEVHVGDDNFIVAHSHGEQMFRNCSAIIYC